MAGEKDQSADEQAMDSMPVTPPDPPQEGGKADEARTHSSDVDDQDPLSAHPS